MDTGTANIRGDVQPYLFSLQRDTIAGRFNTPGLVFLEKILEGRTATFMTVLYGLAAVTPALLFWIIVIILGAILLGRGGGRAERFLIAGAGIMYSSAPEIGFEDFNSLLDDLPKVLPIPVLGVQWNQDALSGLSASFIFPMEAKVQFRTADQRFTTSVEAFEQVADLKVQFSPMLATTLTCALDDGLAYRLAHDNVVLPVDTDEAYLKRDRRLAELMLNVTLPSNFSINIGPYYAFNQKLSVVDKNAKDVHKLELDDSFGAKFEIAWSL